MTSREPIVWRKSSFSADTGNCVEVGWPSERIAVRDSKNTSGPTLHFGRSTWRLFLTQR